MSQSVASKDRHVTWDDDRAWPDDERIEIIGGKVFDIPLKPTEMKIVKEGLASCSYGAKEEKATSSEG